MYLVRASKGLSMEDTAAQTDHIVAGVGEDKRHNDIGLTSPKIAIWSDDQPCNPRCPSLAGRLVGF